jgi:hypothetical protein
MGMGVGNYFACGGVSTVNSVIHMAYIMSLMVNTKLFLCVCFDKHYANEDPLLNSALDGAEYSASCLCRFIPEEIYHGAHWIESWVGPRGILDVVNKKEIFVEIKCKLDATDEFFIAELIACSTCFGHLYAHHQEL